jgi:hypothetical protein
LRYTAQLDERQTLVRLTKAEPLSVRQHYNMIIVRLRASQNYYQDVFRRKPERPAPYPKPTGACLDYALTFADLKSRPTHPVDANLQGLHALVHRRDANVRKICSDSAG